MIKLKLIKTKTMTGYMLDNIKTYLGKAEFDKFEKWIFGETVGIYKGKLLVYKYHFEQFLEGHPPLVF